MLKTVALVGAGIAIGCYYQSCKKNPQKSKNLYLEKCGKQSKDSNEVAKE